MAWDRLQFCSDAGRFLLRAFDDEDSALLFDARSGDTHLITAFDHELLSLLAEQPLTPADLQSALAALLDETDRAELPAHLAHRLEALTALGVIESDPRST